MNFGNIRIIRIVRIVIGVICLGAVAITIAFAARFAFNYQSPAPAFAGGFGGSVKGRIFLEREAIGQFFVGGDDRIRLNVDNLSANTYVLSVFLNGETYSRDLSVAPGLFKLVIAAPGGPAQLRFAWNTRPVDVVLTQLASPDYKIIRQCLYIAGIAALFLLLLQMTRPGIREVEISLSTFVLFFAVFFWIHDNALIPLTGDEPHYMVLSESIIQDGDYDVSDQYSGSFRQIYFPGALTPHTVETPSGTTLTARYPLLALLMGPAFAGPRLAMQIEPYIISKTIMITLSALLAVFLSRALRTQLPAGIALGAVFCVLTTMPFLAHTNQIYPEIAGALLLFVVLSRIWRDEIPAKGDLTSVILIALLPLVNLKFNAAALFCGLALLWKFRSDRRASVVHISILFCGALAAVAFAYFVYGDIIKGPYRGHEFVVKDFWPRYLTYLVDADRGLFALNPLLIFFFPGLVVLFRKDAILAILTIGLIVITNLSGIFQQEETHWLLGYCPAGRYWISVVGIIGWISVQGSAALWRGGGARFRLFLVALTVVAGGLAFSQTAAFVYFQEGYYLPLKTSLNASRYLTEITGVDLSFLFASHPFQSTVAVSAWMIILVVLAALLSFAVVGNERESTRPGRRRRA